MPSFPRSSRRAFTLIELLATIAIAAVLTVSAIVFIGNYVTWSRQTAEAQTLTVLNDALTRYKTQGGNLPALTLGAPIGHIITALQTPVSWNGMTHQFLKAGETYSSESLQAIGEGKQYRFYGYGSYSTETPAAGTPTTALPYGSGVGFLTRTGTIPANVIFYTSTGHLAYKINGGTTAFVNGAANAALTVTLPTNSSLKFWSCAGAADETKSGDLWSMNVFGGSGQHLTSLNVKGLSALQGLYCGGNDFTSLDFSGLTNLTAINCVSNSLMTSLKVAGCTSLEDINASWCALTSLNLSGLTALTGIAVSRNNIPSLALGSLPNLLSLSCSNNALTSLNVSGCPLLESIDCGNNAIPSLSLSNCPGLRTLACSNTSITSLNLGSHIFLEELYCGKTPLTSLSIPSSLITLEVNFSTYLSQGLHSTFTGDYPILFVAPTDPVTPPTDKNIQLEFLSTFTHDGLIDFLNNLPSTSMDSWFWWDGAYTEDTPFTDAVDYAMSQGWQY